ncbi:alpha/beta hydrolase family protein [Streptomyces albiaxialis]|uniref:Alpha/beta hydrolase family protein n=1 Tax=Streptomyces albiaxialis TaxID=329523 RepID=A0ABP5I2D4_9ACTN
MERPLSTAPYARTGRPAVLALLLVLLAPMLALGPGPVAAYASSSSSSSAQPREAVPALLGVEADDGARVTRAVRDGRQLDLTIDSPALGREGHARVLLPPGRGAEARPARTGVPSLWVLHGCCDPGNGWEAWTDRTDIEEATARTRALVVLPEGGPVGFYSDWWNGGEGGPPAWETFHLTELRQILERGLGAGPRRAVAGLSMGGYGALAYAVRHPRMFRAAASFSGLGDTRLGRWLVDDLLPRHGHDPDAVWGDPVAQRDVWRAHNPAELVRRLPRGYPVFVGAGDGTPGPLDPPDARHDALEARLLPSSVSYVEAARARGLRVTADLYGPGTHTWPYWERELHRALPMLTRALTPRS